LVLEIAIDGLGPVPGMFPEPGLELVKEREFAGALEVRKRRRRHLQELEQLRDGVAAGARRHGVTFQIDKTICFAA
jgi:hypothetical protein